MHLNAYAHTANVSQGPASELSVAQASSLSGRMRVQSLLEPHSVPLSDDASFFPATEVNRNFPELLRPLDHSGPTLVHGLVHSKME